MNLSGVFSGDPGDLSRIAPWGVIVTIVGLLVYFFGPAVLPKRALAAKLVGLAVVIVGALGTMKII